MYARRKLSCTTSSASCWLPVIRNASRNKGRLWRSTSTRNASVSPVRALVTRPRSLHSIRLFFRLHGLAAVSKKGAWGRGERAGREWGGGLCHGQGEGRRGCAAPGDRGPVRRELAAGASCATEGSRARVFSLRTTPLPATLSARQLVSSGLRLPLQIAHLQVESGDSDPIPDPRVGVLPRELKHTLDERPGTLRVDSVLRRPLNQLVQCPKLDHLGRHEGDAPAFRGVSPRAGTGRE